MDIMGVPIHRYGEIIYTFLCSYSFPLFVTYLIMVNQIRRIKKMIPEPYDLKQVMGVYNFVISLVNVYCFVGFLSCLLEASSLYEKTPNPKLTRIFYVYWITKVIELLDTVFMILRHKFKQVSLLHVYHHASMLLLSDLGYTRYAWAAFSMPLMLNALFIWGVLLVLVQLSLATPFETESIDSSNESEYQLMCYYNLWASNRVGLGRFSPQDIDPQLCTHLIVSFITINEGQVDIESTFENQTHLLDELHTLGEANPDLKIFAAAGGWEAEGSVLKAISETAEAREVFAKSVVKALEKGKFQGFVVDWEFPEEDDKADYLALHQELKEELKDFKLGTVISPKPKVLSTAYNFEELNKVVDFYQLITYDYHGFWDTTAGANAPLFPSSTAQKPALSLSLSVNSALEQGVPKEKLVVGIGLYGRSAKLTNPEENTFGSLIDGKGTKGEFTNEAGVLAYFEICKYLMSGKEYNFDDETQTPYVVAGDQWMSFDDMQSIEAKLEWMSKEHGLKNVFVWALGMDDFSGTQCQASMSFPLVHTIKNFLGAK
eukprot:maker-scaffold1273_size51358-snap-gene-0.10 protein:Tk12557 transcript:maker-scaffold1273_size51358-snap-gene-0.10-mRNA-1 annotation:"conserved hypothetical protein"